MGSVVLEILDILKEVEKSLLHLQVLLRRKSRRGKMTRDESVETGSRDIVDRRVSESRSESELKKELRNCCELACLQRGRAVFSLDSTTRQLCID